MPEDKENEIAIMAMANYRGQMRPFGIKTDDRRRHMYLIGKTGMGKSTMMENMIVQDIRAGRGLAVVDPHGDLVEKVIKYIPPRRVNDVVYFNPDDRDFPIAFNILEATTPSQRHLIASGLMGVFTKIWAGVWSARMEYILNNSILALLEMPGSTLLGIPRLYVDKDYRQKVVNHLKDPIVKSFWTGEFESWTPQFRSEAVSAIQNKVGQFLSNSIIRNIVGQPKSSLDVRELMDSGKIILFNLAKGRIGEDNAALMGAMMITKLQLAAMSRIDIPAKERKDFYLYVDEFQNFATESFANILSEARKYHLDLIIGHQYIEQLDEEVSPAVFGNVGTIVCFRVGATDAEFLAKEFAPVFTETDLVNLAKYDMYLKLMIDGVASEPFSATGLLPVDMQPEEETLEKVIKVSRERYASPREEVEEKITRWHSAMETVAAQSSREPRHFDRRPSEPKLEPDAQYERSAPVVPENIPEPISLAEALKNTAPANRDRGHGSHDHSRPPRSNHDQAPHQQEQPRRHDDSHRHSEPRQPNRHDQPRANRPAPTQSPAHHVSNPPVTPPPAVPKATNLTDHQQIQPGQVIKIE